MVLISPLLVKFLVDTVLIGERTDLLLLFVVCYAAAALATMALRVEITASAWEPIQ